MGMNQFEFESSWNEIKGALRQKYGQLTDNDVEFVEGKGDELLHDKDIRKAYLGL